MERAGPVQRPVVTMNDRLPEFMLIPPGQRAGQLAVSKRQQQITRPQTPEGTICGREIIQLRAGKELAA